MAGGLNKVMIIGNLGRDPQMRYLPSGTATTTVRVGVSRRRATPAGEKREETEWFAVVFYDKLAETANKWLTKGQRVYVEGRLQTRSWTSQDGQQHARLEVVATDLVFLGGPRPDTSADPTEAPAACDEDQPF